MFPLRPDLTGRAVQRARWLAELALALGEASRVSRAIARTSAGDRDATALHAQIEQLRDEIDRMRRGLAAPGAEYPKRM